MDADPADWVRLEFMEVWLDDQQAGRDHPLEHYLALFPHRGDAVKKAWDERWGADETLALPRPPDSQLLGHYRLLREIGRGGQAQVYLAEDLRLGRQVALKVLPRSWLGEHDERLLRLQREAAITSRLDHAGIGVIHETGIAEGRAFIAMRYVEGMPLADALRERRLGASTHWEVSKTDEAERTPSSGAPTRGELPETLRFVEKAARALHAAHEEGVIHRDVKPGNIMVTSRGDPVLLDFGLARDDSDTSPALTRTGDIFGTPAYMAPEQVLGLAVDRRCDIYGLGATLYECLTLRHPLLAPTRQQLYHAIVHRPPTPPRRQNRNISRDLDVVVMTALEKDPDRRYQTAEAMADDLLAVMEHRPIAARPPSVVSRVVRWTRREPLRAALLLSCVLLAGVLGFLVARLDAIHVGQEKIRQDALDRDLSRAFLALMDRDYVRAKKAFAELQQSEPDDLLVLSGQVLTLARSREVALARRVIEGADPRDARSAATLELLRAALAEPPVPLMAPGDVTTPIEAFVSAMSRLRGLQKDPEVNRTVQELLGLAVAMSKSPRPVFHLTWALACAKTKDRVGLSTSTRAIRELWPRSAIAWATIGRAFEMSSLESGLEAAERGLAFDPGHVPSLVVRGDALVRMNRLDDALASYRQALAVEPDGHDARWGEAQVLVRKNLLPEALERLNEACSLHPESIPLEMHRAYTLLQLNRPEGASKACDRVLLLDPSLAPAYSLRGILHSLEQRDAQALGDFRKAFELDPTDGDARKLIVTALAGGDEPRDLLQVQRTWAQHHGSSPEAWYDVALAALQAEERDEAARALLRARTLLDQTPDDLLQKKIARLQKTLDR